MKRFGAVVLVAAAAASLGAGRSLAATTSSVATSFPPAALVPTDESSLGLGSLLSASRVAMSMSSTSSAGSILLAEVANSAAHVNPVVHVAIPPRVSLGHFHPYRESSRSIGPIPEARTTLLYGFGILAVGWAVLRSRRASSPHAG